MRVKYFSGVENLESDSDQGILELLLANVLGVIPHPKTLLPHLRRNASHAGHRDQHSGDSLRAPFADHGRDQEFAIHQRPRSGQLFAPAVDATDAERVQKIREEVHSPATFVS